MKILWCITGAGHFLEETVEFMETMARKHEVTAVFSTAALEVVKMYGFFERVKKISREIILEQEQGASSPFVGKVTSGKYNLILVAPCTANTTAKIAHGIADSLVTNLVAQAIKSKLSVTILPTDYQKKEITTTPEGKKVPIYLRSVDINNVKKAEQLEGMKVIRKLEELKIKK